MRNDKRFWWLGAAVLFAGGLALVNACGDVSGSSGETGETQELAGSFVKDNVNDENGLKTALTLCHANENVCPTDKDAPCEMDEKIGKCIVSCPEIQNEETCNMTWYCRWRLVPSLFSHHCRRNDRVKILGPSVKFGDSFIWGQGTLGF
ncbi:MAG: hypothetical protein AAF471_00685 [Myxococcota bacterium]